jgi:type IV fimbrial biogenesis protein FimT
MRSNSSGMTLIELLVGLTIAAILMALAAPSFVRLLKSNSMAGSVNTFMADVRYARSEAIRRGAPVIVCRSDDPESATPLCADGGSTTADKGWASGWVIFEDVDGDRALDVARDRVVRVQPALRSIDSIQDGSSGSTRRIAFTGTGRLYEAAQTATMRFGGPGYEPEQQRVVCLAVSGRARIAGDANATCGANNE